MKQKNKKVHFSACYYNPGHNILRLFDVILFLFSSQVKQCVIISYKHGIYDFPYELLNNLRFRILGN